MSGLYYEDDYVTLYHGDAREMMPAEGLVVTDPPFNIGYEYASWSDNMAEADYADMLRITCRAPSIVVHLPASMFTVARAIDTQPSKVVAWTYNAHVGDSWRAVAWFGCDPDLTLERLEYRNPNDPRVRRLMDEGRSPRIRDWWHMEQVKGGSIEKIADHHCQMPLSLMQRILNVTPNSLPIVDPFSGTGTTLRAAKDLGRKAVGIEIDERYCEVIARRLSQETLGLAL